MSISPIERLTYEREWTRRVREATVLQAQIDTVLEQMSGIMHEMMNDPLCFTFAEDLLNELNATLGFLQDAIDRNKEDIEFLTYCMKEGVS